MSNLTPSESEHHTPSIFHTLCTETLCTGVTSSIHLGSLDTKILYLELLQKVHLAPICELVILYQPCSKGSDLHQARHVCVIPWVSYELIQGLLSFAHMILPVMCLNSHWLQMSLRSLCLLFVRSLVLRILLCIPRCFHLLHDELLFRSRYCILDIIHLELVFLVTFS